MNALEVGFLDSLAWRSEGEVHVALHLPTVDATGAVAVRFRDGDRRVRRPGIARPAATGTTVEVSVPARRLAGGPWRIAVRAGDAETFTRVEARLLAVGGRPVALLPGPPPRTRMPEPEPQPLLPSAPQRAERLARRAVAGVRRRVRRQAGSSD